ncbi:hypothetical protein DIPPA_33799 [Diplonema papillatum]|nr:hypothetical protein DIPPA_33799 [Diplonema papillatum]
MTIEPPAALFSAGFCRGGGIPEGLDCGCSDPGVPGFIDVPFIESAFAVATSDMKREVAPPFPHPPFFVEL